MASIHLCEDTDGKEEMEMSRKYKANADIIRTDSPKTVSIYDHSSVNYYRESEADRDEAEYFGM